jgi:hypothetical protein
MMRQVTNSNSAGEIPIAWSTSLAHCNDVANDFDLVALRCRCQRSQNKPRTSSRPRRIPCYFKFLQDLVILTSSLSCPVHHCRQERTQLLRIRPSSCSKGPGCHCNNSVVTLRAPIKCPLEASDRCK